jgi:hypothetical protein
MYVKPSTLKNPKHIPTAHAHIHSFYCCCACKPQKSPLQNLQPKGWVLTKEQTVNLKTSKTFPRVCNNNKKTTTPT